MIKLCINFDLQNKSCLCLNLSHSHKSKTLLLSEEQLLCRCEDSWGASPPTLGPRAEPPLRLLPSNSAYRTLKRLNLGFR